MTEKDVENGKAPEAAEVVAPAWHSLSVKETITLLRANENLREVGLSSKEAEERLAEYGPNKLTEKKKVTLLERIWHQVNNVLVFILAVVAVVSAARAITATDSTNVVTNWIQVGLIIGVVSLNTYIGIFQEGSAEKAADALKNMLSSDARVLRNGMEVVVPSQDVVPGDIVFLGLGDRVPADMRMIDIANLSCEEAALTGESLPIEKTVDAISIPKGAVASSVPLGDRHNMAFSATLVSTGSGVGVAIATGDNTQIGTINALVNKVEKKKTNVLKQIDTVSKWIAFFVIISGIATFLVSWLKADISVIDSVSIALICAVGMIPEGLEAIVTMTYAWAVSNMAKQNAIIRALPAVETLGSVTIICSDKTGTLTKNEMSLTAFVTSNSHYKIDNDSVERVNTTFVREDTFMATRAEHQVGRHLSEIVKDGPNTNVPRRGQMSASNHFAITKLETPTSSGHDVPLAVAAEDDGIPVSNGESPDMDYIRKALAGGILCSKCVLGTNGSRDGQIGNPTELSILRAAYFAGVDIEELKKIAPLISEVPFSSEYKFMATVHAPVKSIDGPGLDDKIIVYAKGAPDKMIDLCSHQAVAGLLDTTEKVNHAYWTQKIATLSSHGLRVLALCRAVIPKSEVIQGAQLGPEFINGRGAWLTIIGLCAIMDPPRPECVQAIKEAHGAGVRVAMITGDHKDTATAIGQMLGIVDAKYSSAITGTELDALSDDELQEAVMTHNVFARASPQNKIRIVKALQARGEVCGMTGDGVNDAPALKAADMGVAMGKDGTDVAREASEMILADDNFATIVVAVREGRVVWDNLRKILLVNTPINNAQGLSILFGLICGLDFTVLTSIQVLYSNLVCACTLGFVCAIEPAEEGIMNLPPRRVGKRLIGRYLLLRICIGTVLLVAAVVGSVFWSKSIGHGDIAQLRAQAFNVLDFGAVAVTLSARFAYISSSPFKKAIYTGNKYCWYSVALMTVLQIFCTYTPGVNDVIFQMEGMAPAQWGITILCTVLVFIGMECEKSVRRMLHSKGEDTDDREAWILDASVDDEKDKDMTLPKGASALNLVELRK